MCRLRQRRGVAPPARLRLRMGQYLYLVSLNRQESLSLLTFLGTAGRDRLFNHGKEDP